MNERTAHADLLAQVERDEATRDEIRRILSTWPNCCGACDQGRKLCICPEQCLLPESDEPDDDDAIGTFRGLVNSLPCAVLLWIAIAVAVATVLRAWPY